MSKPKPHALARASATLASTPRAVALRALAAVAAGSPPPRGTLLQLDRFFQRLAAERRPPEEATEEDYAAVAPTRGRLLQLLNGLSLFAPDVPQGPARALRRAHDRTLNARYRTKARRPRVYDRAAIARDDWPEAWREAWRRLADPTLEERAALERTIMKPLAPATLAATEQSVGLFLAARAWAGARGVALSLALDAQSAEGFARYLRHERACRERSVVAHLERLRRFARRGLRMDTAALRPFGVMIAAWTARAQATTKRKIETLKAFYERQTLADIPQRAAALAAEAAALPGHGRRAERLRLKAAVLALTVNAPERLADLAALRFGADGLSRHPSGAWALRITQAKTKRIKHNHQLWPEVGALLDGLILGDRPPHRAQERYAALRGMFVLSLGPEPAHRELASVFYREEFGISEHAVRTLVVDLFRNDEPESAAACRALLGHRDVKIHEEYRTDFKDAAAMRKYRAVLEARRASPRDAGVREE